MSTALLRIFEVAAARFALADLGEVCWKHLGIMDQGDEVGLNSFLEKGQQKMADNAIEGTRLG